MSSNWVLSHPVTAGVGAGAVAYSVLHGCTGDWGVAVAVSELREGASEVGAPIMRRRKSDRRRVNSIL